MFGSGDDEVDGASEWPGDKCPWTDGGRWRLNAELSRGGEMGSLLILIGSGDEHGGGVALLTERWGKLLMVELWLQNRSKSLNVFQITTKSFKIYQHAHLPYYTK